MPLSKDEKAIIAGFKTMAQGEQAKNEIEQQLNPLDTSLERVSLYTPTEYEKRPENAITGDYPGLPNGVFDMDTGNEDARIMMAASPSASGLSDGGEEDIGRDVVLTVVCKNEDFEQAKAIVEKHGGEY